MKGIILIAMLILGTSLANAQVVVEGININERKDIEYIQMVAYGKGFSKKVTIVIDYGQQQAWWTTKDQAVDDPETGKRKVFFSVIDALNFLHRQGWEYVNHEVYSEESRGMENVSHFLFRKMPDFIGQFGDR